VPLNKTENCVFRHPELSRSLKQIERVHWKPIPAMRSAQACYIERLDCLKDFCAQVGRFGFGSYQERLPAQPCARGTKNRVVAQQK